MVHTTTARRRIIIGAMAAATSLLAACAANPTTGSAASSGSHSSAPTIKKDAALAAMLPDSVKSSGKLVSVDSGSFPPYTIVGTGGGAETGASADMEAAVGKLLGVTIENNTIDGLAGELAGIGAGRYNFAFGPVGDFKSRQAQNDFVDWVQEHVVFAVLKGNPKHINSIADTCGLAISVQAGGSAEKVINGQSTQCTAAGKPAIQVQSYKDQPTSLLAVSSHRADAFFSSQAPLTYFTQHSNDELELAGTGQANGFDKLYQGAVVPKGSALGPVLSKAFQELDRNGTYKSIMDKWGLSANEISNPGINLAVS